MRVLVLLALAALALAHSGRRTLPLMPSWPLDDRALENMTHVELVRLVRAMRGGPASLDEPEALGAAQYWWQYKRTDCGYHDVEGSCLGKTIDECKMICLATKGCGGFNFPHGILKAMDCSNFLAAEGSVDTYVLKSVPQPPSTAWPPVWPLPAKYSAGSVPLHVDALKFTFPSPTNNDLRDAYARMKPLFFPHTAVKLTTSDPVLTSLTVSIKNLSVPLQFGVDESYTLVIPADGTPATINAATYYGALHALQTLSQLVTFNFETQTYFIPGAPWKIDDKPRFSHRELLVDSSRHFLPLPILKRMIEAVTYAKINVIHWHIVDSQSFPFVPPSLPNLGISGSYSANERYTADDIATIVEFARTRGVRIMLEIDVPGHAASWCHGNDRICPSDVCLEPLNVASEETFTVIGTLFSDIVKIVPDTMLHLGGDEVDTGCWERVPRVKAWMNEKGMNANQAYEYFVKRAQGLARNLGRDVVGWEEIWNHFGTSLDKSTILHQWLPNSKIVQPATLAGYRVVVSNAGIWYLDYLDVSWKTMYLMEPCEGVRDDLCDTKVVGGGGEMWGETVDTSVIEATVFPRLGAIAERLWSPRDTRDVNLATPRYAAFRCLLNSRGIGAAPYNNGRARTNPPGPGGCYVQ